MCTSVFLGICSNRDTPSRVIVQISTDISKLLTGLCKSHPTSRIYRQDLCKRGWQKSVFDVQIEFQVFFFSSNFQNTLWWFASAVRCFTACKVKYPKAGPPQKRAPLRFRFGGTFGSSKSGPPLFMCNLKFQEKHVLLLIWACKGTNIQPGGCAPWTLSFGVFSARTKPEIYKEPIVYWPSVSHGRRLFRLSYFVLVAYWFPCANYWSFWHRPNRTHGKFPY